MGILLGLGNQPRIIVKRPDGCVRFWRWSLSTQDFPHHVPSLIRFECIHIGIRAEREKDTGPLRSPN